MEIWLVVFWLMFVFFNGTKIQLDYYYFQFEKGNSTAIIPQLKSLKRMIPKNKNVSNVFFIKSDEMFSRNTPKKYATGIQLKNQGPSVACKPNISYTMLKKSQKVINRKPE